MARTGRFGRQPRAAQSLTNSLVAIAREFQNQRASNIMDAWQKGGMFEGKKATDDVVLAFWKNKMAGVSQDDPLYDTYKNAHSQLDYTIHESKMTAGYATKKYSDGQMVAFYLNWAKKVPKDSEFYRVLQRDAGQYMRTSRSNGEAEKRAAEERRYQSQQNGTRKTKEAAGEYVIDTLRRIAQSGFVNGGIAQVISGPGSGSDLTDFDPNDPDVMLRLMDAIAPRTGPDTDIKTGRASEGKVRGNPLVLYHDDDKNPVTGADILAKLETLDPEFAAGVPFNTNYVTGLLDRQMQGLNERMERAKKTGHMTDYNSLSKSKGYVAMLNREVAAYPVQKAYQEARSDYDAVVSDKSSSPQAVLKAWETYSATLTSLSNDPRIEADDATRSRLIAERDGTAGVPTLHESFTGLSSGEFDAGSVKDAVENAAGIQFMLDQVEAVASGQATWAYGTTNDDGVFVPTAGGREIGAATPDAVRSGGVNPQSITVPDPLGGSPLQIAVTAVPIYATAKDQFGEPLDVENPNPIGWAYDTPSGSGTTTMYGFMTTSGYRFSSDPPWDSSRPATASSKGGNHLEVDFTPKALYGKPDPVTGMYPADSIDLSKAADLGGGFHVQVDTPGTPGVITFNPQATAWSSGTRDGLGSPDPTSDFSSITLARLMSDPEGQQILANLDSYPSIKSQIETDNYQQAGYNLDMKTGVWVPGAEADPAKLDGATRQMGLAQNAKSFSQFVADAGKTWQRVTTGSIFSNDQRGSGSGPDFTLNGFKKLATDLVQGTPFEALGNMFANGTSTIKPPDINDSTGFSIKPATSIKVPKMPDVPTITSTMGPKPAAPVTQQGSAPPTSYQQQQGSTAPNYSGKKIPV